MWTVVDSNSNKTLTKNPVLWRAEQVVHVLGDHRHLRCKSGVVIITFKYVGRFRVSSDSGTAYAADCETICTALIGGERHDDE